MVSSAYNYYLTQYGSKLSSRYQSSARKPSDVKRAYNKLQSINRTTPTYKIDLSERAQRYAIDLKENARELSNIANDLTGTDGSEMAMRRQAESDAPEIVSARYIGQNEASTQSFVVEVQQLALPQQNMGNFLPPGSKYLRTGEYSFDLKISDLTYEFQFGVNPDDTSKTVQEKLARLINRSNIGLTASVDTDELGNTAISITSNNTGVKSTAKPKQFEIIENPTESSAETSSVEVLGLNRTIQYPSNAFFTVDGAEQSAISNHIRINSDFELELHQKTSGVPVTISIEADSDSVVDSITELVSGYNNLVSVATDEGNTFTGTGKLRRQFNSIAHAYGSMLSNSGLDIDDNGFINVNPDTVKELVQSDSVGTVFESLGKFKTAIQDTAEKIAMNPMEYVNNKIIAYKNPYRITTDPYNTSAYSGMMFNGYI